MESEFEIDLSDFEDDAQPNEQPLSEPLPSKPKRKYTKSQKVLDNARKNLEKAREIKKQQSVHRGGFQKFEYEDSHSDDGSDESEDEYTEPFQRNAPSLRPIVSKEKQQSKKKTSKLSNREMKLMEKLERIEGLMSQFSNTKHRAGGSGKKNVHKTVIVQPPPQYMPYRQRDPAVEKMKKSLLNDMF